MGHAQLFCTQALLGVMIALRLTLLATAAFAAPRPKLMPTLSSSLDTGSPMPITSLPQLSPFARLSLRPSPSDRDATPSPTAPPRPLFGKKITGHEDPTCTDVEHVVPAVHAV